jgi:hypothetical protein
LYTRSINHCPICTFFFTIFWNFKGKIFDCSI